jgi:dihydrodipicolinate synthase/N-acetylneuraminate lyase
MKQTAKLAAIVSAGLLCVGSAAEPTAESVQEQQQLSRVVKELQEQQATIADNQTKIEAKLAAVAEAVRQARIFASRAGHQ